ncbi:RNase H1/viroplasmin domain-containing protein, partial [candidate division KSB1 bacterium]|nr:RNase H1/viroplasmin domain-containing protein [candidate division KSB1 bacterium]
MSGGRKVIINRGFTVAKKKYYVIFRGRTPGIYNEWYGKNGAEEQIIGFPNARYQGFVLK